MKILIDNGHGENTPGKRSPDGVFREYLWTRETAASIVRALRMRGYDAELLVKESVDVPLQERCRRVNDWCRKLGKTRVLLVSVHVDACGNGSRWYTASGWSCWTSKGETQADVLAKMLFESAVRHLTGRKIRTYRGAKDPDFEENFYILKNTQCPAVLTENFFQDNHDDVEYLMSPEGKEAVVKTHVEGIISYITSRK